MIIGDSVEVLLRIECAAQEQRKVTVRSFDDVGDLVDCLTAVESILICEPVLDDAGKHNAGTQCLGHARDKSGIHNRRATKWG